MDDLRRRPYFVKNVSSSFGLICWVDVGFLRNGGGGSGYFFFKKLKN